MSRSANYNKVAFFYDELAHLVFLGTIKKSQKSLLSHIPENSRILIVGGGTGWILEEIAKLQLSDLHIIFVEHSSQMMVKAKCRDCQDLHVDFIQHSIQDLDLAKEFDVVITPFFFDNLPSTEARGVFSNISSSLRFQGKWLHVDFQDKRAWQRGFLKLMYHCFNILCKVQTTALPPVESYFKEGGYVQIEHKNFFKGFISAKAYLKN